MRRARAHEAKNLGHQNSPLDYHADRKHHGPRGRAAQGVSRLCSRKAIRSVSWVRGYGSRWIYVVPLHYRRATRLFKDLVESGGEQQRYPLMQGDVLGTMSNAARYLRGQMRGLTP